MVRLKPKEQDECADDGDEASWSLRAHLYHSEALPSGGDGA
jgi:hypothetical protein